MKGKGCKKENPQIFFEKGNKTETRKKKEF
jgi:hypothetical protein